MGTIADKLSYLVETKSRIRAAIKAKGIEIPDDATFRDFAPLINQINDNGGAVRYNIGDFVRSYFTSRDYTDTSDTKTSRGVLGIGETSLSYSLKTINGGRGATSASSPSQTTFFYFPKVIPAGTEITVELRWPEYTVDSTGYNEFRRTLYLCGLSLRGSTSIRLIDGELSFVAGIGGHVIDRSTAKLTAITDTDGEIVGVKMVASLIKDVNEIQVSGSYHDWDGSGYITATVDATFASEDDLIVSTRPPLAYLYNGVQLPALPEWDKETYPYACITASAPTTDYSYLLRLYAKPFACDGSNLLPTEDDDYPYMSFGYYEETNEWGNGSGLTSWNGADSGRLPLWSNHDIVYPDDDTVYLAAGDPVPVYE